MSTAREVRVEVRGITLAEAVSCETSDDGVFVPIDDPPPVRTILAIVEGDGAREALEVTSVVEVPPEGGKRGFRGRFLEADALARFERVGTEHLPDGEAEASESPADGEGEADEGAAGIQMAMPAPVVVDLDESEPIDVDDRPAPPANEDEPEANEDEPEANEDEPEADATEQAAEPDAEASASDEESPRKGKRRRGRKRR